MFSSILIKEDGKDIQENGKEYGNVELTGVGATTNCHSSLCN
jgi:hypothetical protein